MTRDLTIRRERPGDETAICAVHESAFPSDDEARLVDALRASKAFIPALSLVAVAADGIVGHVLLTRVVVDGEHEGDALALAPVAVRPEMQRAGTGSALIRAAIDGAREHDETLIVLLGHADYYPRFGFVPAAPLGVHAPFDVPADVWMALPLSADHPRGTVRYSEPFGGPLQLL